MSKKFRGWIWLYSLLVLYSHTSTRWHWWGKAGSEDLLLQRQYVQFQLGVCFARTRGFLVHPFFSATLRTKVLKPRSIRSQRSHYHRMSQVQVHLPLLKIFSAAGLRKQSGPKGNKTVHDCTMCKYLKINGETSVREKMQARCLTCGPKTIPKPDVEGAAVLEPPVETTSSSGSK